MAYTNAVPDELEGALAGIEQRNKLLEHMESVLREIAFAHPLLPGKESPAQTLRRVQNAARRELGEKLI